MAIDFSDFEDVQKFLDGEMTPKEEQVFFEKVKQNSSLADHLDFEAELQNYLYTQEFEKYSVNLKQENLSVTVPKTEEEKKLFDAIKNNKIEIETGGRVINLFRRRGFYYIAAASLAAIVLTIVGINYFQSSSPANETAYIDVKNETKGSIPVSRHIDSNQRIKKASIADSSRGVNYASLADTFYKKDKPDKLTAHMSSKEIKDFNRGDYTSIQKLNLDKVSQTGNTDEDRKTKDLSYYYKGLSYMETNNPHDAVKNLRRVADSTQNEQLKIKAWWYLSLAYLKDNNSAKAIEFLTKVKGNHAEHFYQQKASLLLDKIKRND
jgi:hypothetical protein